MSKRLLVKGMMLSSLIPLGVCMPGTTASAAGNETQSYTAWADGGYLDVWQQCAPYKPLPANPVLTVPCYTLEDGVKRVKVELKDDHVPGDVGAAVQFFQKDGTSATTNDLNEQDVCGTTTLKVPTGAVAMAVWVSSTGVDTVYIGGRALTTPRIECAGPAPATTGTVTVTRLKDDSGTATGAAASSASPLSIDHRGLATRVARVSWSSGRRAAPVDCRRCPR
jgi:hypothetical protein